MYEAPPFFLPKFSEQVTAENEEQIYEALAALCGTSPPASRIYSITYRHDGVEWTATVGQKLTGLEHKKTRSKGQVIERTIPRSDATTVLAIFPGNPYYVATDARFGGPHSGWESPFMAGIPLSVSYFNKSK